MQPEQVSSAWLESVSGPAGAFVPGLYARRESAEVNRAFTEDGSEWGRLYRLGDVRIAGRLLAFDPATLLKPLPLPVDVPDRDCVVFARIGEYTEMVLVRFGGGPPEYWYELLGDNEHGPLIEIDTGMYAIASESLLAAAAADKSLRRSVVGLCPPGGRGIGQVGGQPGWGVVVNGDIGGDVPAWCYVGHDGVGEVTALVVAIITDPIYAFRPPADDGAALKAISSLIKSVDGDTDFDELIETWESLEAIVASGRPFTIMERADMHSLLAKLETA